LRWELNMRWTVEYIKPDCDTYSGDVKKQGENDMHTLREYYTYLEVKHRKEKTQSQYKQTAKYFLRHLNKEPYEITKDDVQRYVAHLNKKYKQNTVTSYVMGMDLFLEHIGKKELWHPIPNWEQTHRDTITKKEIQNILRHGRNKCHLMDYLILLFITDLDCRPHEISKSQWKWIKGNKIHFIDCKTGNTYSFLTDELETTLELWKEKQSPPSKYIFTNYQGKYKGKPITQQTQKVRDLVHKLSKEVVGRKLNPQDLRASVITEEFNSYINPKTIQRKARHRSFKTTMKYNHTGDKELLEYLNTGTIFNNKEPISGQKLEIAPYKRSFKRLSPIQELPQELNNIDEEDNSSYSFSFFSFYFIIGDNLKDFSSISYPHFSSLGYLPPSSHLCNIGDKGGQRFSWEKSTHYSFWESPFHFLINDAFTNPFLLSFPILPPDQEYYGNTWANAIPFSQGVDNTPSYFSYAQGYKDGDFFNHFAFLTFSILSNFTNFAFFVENKERFKYYNAKKECISHFSTHYALHNTTQSILKQYTYTSFSNFIYLSISNTYIHIYNNGRETMWG